MKLALCAVATLATVVFGGGCATYCRPPANCETPFAESLWSGSCETAVGCTTSSLGCTTPRGGGLLQRLFGGCTDCGSAMCGGGPGCTASSMAGEYAVGAPVPGGRGLMAAGMQGAGMGCAGNVCDGRCGGRCGLAARAANLAHRPFANAQAACMSGCGAMGPTQGAVTYPYYTTRGPRDFLLANPPSIGP